MILTLTILCQLCIGASFALACRDASVQRSVWRAPALPALLFFELGLVVPPCIYSLWRFPQTVYPDRLGAVGNCSIALLLAVVGLLLARLWLVRGRITAAWSVAFFGLLLLPLGVWLHGRQDLTGLSLRDNSHIVALWRVVWPLQGIGWIFCLWRLSLFDQVQRRAAGLAPQSSSLQLISAEILSVARPAGTRKHAPPGGPRP